MKQAENPNLEKARQVRRMFDGIARRYDLLNHLLSAGADIAWRKASVRRLARAGLPLPVRVLDLCCGTGDFAFDAARLGPVTAADFSLPMLNIAARKARDRALGGRVRFLAADALQLPFPDATFAAVTVAFGARNYADLPAGLAEMRRVLRPGGVAGILELSRPWLPGFNVLFRLWFHGVAPRIGRRVSGDPAAYTYLPESVDAFPPPREMVERMEAAGFRPVRSRRFLFGVAVFYTGVRP
jgi:demethylmenaquinone methyltransferase/2-methoxy-6-polyprenyl-1,4-benzoquinol methylase